MSETILTIDQVKIHARCKKCGSNKIERDTKLDTSTSLWELVERCTMCGWGKTVPNVKAGV